MTRWREIRFYNGGMTNPAAEQDPRVYFAAERTFLAWIRTSISIIVFGFVVAKFGITLRELLLVSGNTVRESGVSLLIGLGFMVMGIFMALAAWFRYQSTMRRIETGDFKPAKAIVTVLAVLAALFGIILAVYLIFTARAL